MAKKRGILDGYKTYSPEIEGYGDAAQWRACFHDRMGVDVAREVVGELNPIEVLGLRGKPTWDEIKKAYKKLVGKYHPDRNGNSKESNDRFVEVCAAFEVLEIAYGK
jgi:hypothetical protein